MARRDNSLVMGQLYHNSNTTVNENSDTTVGCLASAAMKVWPFPFLPYIHNF